MNPQTLDVGDLCQLRCNPGQPGVVESQGVATGKNHFRNRNLLCYIVEDRLPGFAVRLMFLVREVPPKAIPAVYGACPAGDNQNATLVFVEQTLKGRE